MSPLCFGLCTALRFRYLIEFLFLIKNTPGLEMTRGGFSALRVIRFEGKMTSIKISLEVTEILLLSESHILYENRVGNRGEWGSTDFPKIF